MRGKGDYGKASLRGGLVLTMHALEPTEATIPFHDYRNLLEANLARQIEAIRAADVKIALLVPTTTAMLGVLAALLRNARHIEAAQMAVVCLSAAPLLVAFAMMATGVIPRLRDSGSSSLLFFGGIATRQPEAARDAMLSLSPQAYLADLAGQCTVTAGIARTKHQHVRRAYLAFFLALPFWLVAVYVLNSGL